MGQDWVLSENGCFQQGHTELMDELRLPCLPEDFDQWLKNEDGALTVEHSILLKLPDEILDMIFAELRDYHILLFALTCTRLLRLGKRHIVKFIDRAVPTWANCRIICLGEYLESTGDLPAGMLTEDEQAIIAAEKPRIYARLGIPLDHDDEYPEPVGDLLRVLGTLPDASQEQKYYSNSSIRFIHKRLLQETLWRWGPLAWSKRPTRDLERYTALLGSYPQGPEVVCNLTKGEYIRRDALKLVPEQVTLAHALISQVCWSADYSCALPVTGFEEKIERGPWAGDRFCITTVDRMPKLDAGEWVDVSAAVDQMLAVMCEHEFSDD